MLSQHRIRLALFSFLLWAVSIGSLPAYDVIGIQPNAFGLPEINLVLRSIADAAPYTGLDDAEDPFTNIRMILDSGASGVVLFENQTLKLGIPLASSGGVDVAFTDVGVGGSTTFAVSLPTHISLGHFASAVPDNYDPMLEASTYPRQYPGINLQLGPPGSGLGPSGLGFLGPFDYSGIAGMTVLQEKIIVMEPRFAEILGDTIRSYVYEPGVAPLSGPGILPSNLTVSLSMKDFSRFTSVSPAGSNGPSLAANPFIGPDPLTEFEGQDPSPTAPPGVLLNFNGMQTVQSLLLDTGNQTSSISSFVANALGVRYQAGTQHTSAPILESFDPSNPTAPATPLANQFSTVVGGIAGTESIAGFYLDSLQLKTQTGDPANDSDPNHLNFIAAPVYVQDIALRDPVSNETFTLAGIIGMNYLMASFGSDFTSGPFESVVLDFSGAEHGSNSLGLFATDYVPRPALDSRLIPIPSTVLLPFLALVGVIGWRYSLVG